MFLTLFKKNTLVFITTSIIAVSAFFISCQKEFSGNGIDLGDELPDLTTKIASSVAGFVTDENEVAVNGATVVFGSSTTTTDKFGYFEVRNVQVTQIAAVVTVIKPGYFKGIKTYIATAGKSAFFRIKLLPKTTVGNIDAAAGGYATLSNGLSITLPAGAVVNAATNAAYTGSVTVAAQWLNPTASDLYRIMPGDLRGLDSLNVMRLLTTYGMSAVELTGASGELLQIAAGKKATLNFPLPTAVAGTAPATIPLWYFDETKGLWKQEGNAVKSGNNYIGEVSHFSYWNCDLPNAIVPLTFTIVDPSGKPISNAHIEIIPLTSNSWSHIGGYTDSSGYVSVSVTPNAQYSLSIYNDCSNSVPAYSQNFSSATTGIDLGIITLPSAITASISGNVVDCGGLQVTDGYVILQYGDRNSRTIIKPDGTFSLNTLICTTNTGVNIIAINNAALQQSNTQALTLVSGNNNAGTLNACGNSIEQFINYSVNGTDYTIAALAGNLYGGVSPQADVYIQGSAENGGQNFNSVSLTFEESGIAVNSSQKLLSFNTNQISDSAYIAAPVLVNITEYGSVGQFIAGNFTGTFTGAPPANTPYNVTCSFRVKRSQ